MHRKMVWSVRACAVLAFLFATPALCGGIEVAGSAWMRRALLDRRNAGWSGHQPCAVLAPPAAPLPSLHPRRASPASPPPPPLVPLASLMTYMASNKTQGSHIDMKHLTRFYENTIECPPDIVQELSEPHAPRHVVCSKAMRLYQKRIRYDQLCAVYSDWNQEFNARFECDRVWRGIVRLESYFYTLFMYTTFHGSEKFIKKNATGVV